ncbi:histidine kinase [Simiduia sp. 21SJ11W-1]|uniref:sensor histidine kinase n=1 Tax=Simiduia sp. 21SJ11W-1 TaxID=2909669 RepID=UPI0020A12A93|nr:histidine kinase [Simiduia sp. 21SJ11W-1]UTA46951.1 histidine kinase [Simiduia sp. 21SJ11W-1]
MHPLFNSNRSLLTLIFTWVVLCCLIALLLWELTDDAPLEARGLLISLYALPLYLLLLFFCSANYYLCMRLPANQYALNWLFIAHASAALLTVGLWLMLGQAWSQLLENTGLTGARTLHEETLWINGLLGLVLYCAWVLVHYTYLIAKGDEANNAQALAQKLLISDIELQAVKATVHPHFMYNSLNMLANLSVAAPEKIHDICVQMSEFLRYSVNYAKKDTVTIHEELTHIENYLAIEKERFGKNLAVTIDVDPACLYRPAMPLLLFPLVENCIKHGIQSQLAPGYISLVMKPLGEHMEIQVENSFDPEGQKAESTNHGLASLKKRMGGHYGAGATLNIAKSANTFKVTLKLPHLTQPSTLKLGVDS